MSVAGAVMAETSATETISMPWAAVRVTSPVDTSVFELLRPFARREEDGSGAADSRCPLVANVCVAALEDCADGVEAGPEGEPLLLHQGHRGSIRKLDSGHLVVNRSRGVHYHVEPGSPPAVTCCVVGGRPEVDVLQIVRGLLVGAGAELLAPLHGAVLSTANGDGILVAGEKGAGKTSFALGLLSGPGRDGAGLVSNDKVLIDTESLRAYGLPYAIAICDGTLGALPELAGLPRRRESGKSLFWPVEIAAALGFRLVPSVVLREQWWCGLDLSRLGVVLRSAPPPDQEPSALAKFTSNLLPVWLLQLLGSWAPRPPVNVVDVPASRVEGNPWRSWLPRPVG
jgi:hypothetical protein